MGIQTDHAERKCSDEKYIGNEGDDNPKVERFPGEEAESLVYLTLYLQPRCTVEQFIRSRTL